MNTRIYFIFLESSAYILPLMVSICLIQIFLVGSEKIFHFRKSDVSPVQGRPRLLNFGIGSN